MFRLNIKINLEFAVNMKKTVQTQDKRCLHPPSSTRGGGWSIGHSNINTEWIFYQNLSVGPKINICLTITNFMNAMLSIQFLVPDA